MYAFFVLLLFFVPIYIQAEPAKVKLTPEEAAYLETLGLVRLCVDPDWRPYERITSDGRYSGIAADLLEMISFRSGVKFELVHTRDWEESIAFSRSGKCDVLSFLNQTPEREQWLIFTEPYFNDYNVFITLQEHEPITNPANLINKSVALPAGTSVEERLRRDYPNLNLILTASEAEAIELVSEGEADMTMRSRIMAAYTITREGMFNLKIAGIIPEYSNQLRMGVSKDKPMLRDILNKAVATITEEDVQTAINNHISIQIQTPIDYGLILRIAAGLLVLIAIAFVWNYQLRRLNRKLETQQKELVLAKQQADAANKAKSDFLAHMSHEIRTPLNSVIGFTDLLKNNTLPGECEKYADFAHSSSQSLLAIINDILDFSKIEAGKIELELINTNLRQLINEVVGIIGFQADSKGIKLIIALPENMPAYILTDPVRLKQILINLLGNAVKFTKEGQVELQVEFYPTLENNGRFRFVVRDSGIGISEEHQKKLFNAFMQADHSTTRKYGGSGLGLAISGQLAAIMGSKIELQSEIDKGSEFSFVLETAYEDVVTPAVAEANDKPEETLLSEDHPANTDEGKKTAKSVDTSWRDKPYRILIAEDVYLNIELLKIMLNKIFQNPTIEEAENGKEAVQKAAKEAFDIILMDIQMPEMDGVEATRLIRQQYQKTNQRSIIIALTARVMKEDQEVFSEAGMDGYISKPINNDLLIEILQRHLA